MTANDWAVWLDDDFVGIVKARPDYSGNEEIVIGRVSFDKPAPAQTASEIDCGPLHNTPDGKWYYEAAKVSAYHARMQAEVRKLQEALVAAAIPLEVLAISSADRMYYEFSPELQTVICEAVVAIRAALKGGEK